ncbi:hypothetical protein MMC19_003038 [Ptychographa xylographoides]|nr:hypothetical protein [Ptychographa xylographoides]
MKISHVSIVAVLQLLSKTVLSSCAADNCARAVTGTRLGSSAQQSHFADCSSFMEVVVTPATSTATVTATITGAATNLKRGFEVVERRQVTVTPSSVPTYASACSGTARYSSACSCAGITKSTSTAPTPVTTVTVSVTAASSLSTPPGVTYSVITSPASVYHLPTPTTSLQAVVVTDTGNPDLAPYTAYFNPDGSFADEIGLTIDGTFIVFDISNPAQIAFTFPDGNSVVVDATGVYLYAADGSSELVVTIADFVSMFGGTAPPPPRLRSRSTGAMQRRDATTFEVDVSYFDQCGNPDGTSSPQIQSGNTPCSVSSLGVGVYAGTCTFPDVNAIEAACEASVKGALDSVTGGFFGSITNWGAAAAFIAFILRKGVLAEVAAGIAAVLDAPIIGTAIGGFALFELVVAGIGSANIAHGICAVLYFDYTLVVTVDGVQGDDVLAVLDAPPTAAIATSYTVSDPAVPSCSATTAPCAGGVCATYQNCGPSSDCYCGSDTAGNSACFLSQSCDELTQCGSNADCGGTEICLVSNCCGYNVCSDVADCAGPAGSRRRWAASRGLPANATLYNMGVMIGGHLTPGNATL